MNGILICFVVGATLFHQLETLPGLGWLALLLPFPLLWRFTLLRPFMGLLVGAGWSLLHANLLLQEQLPVHLEGKDLIMEGVIDSLPVRHGRLARFQMRVTSLSDGKGSSLGLSRVQISWYGAQQTLNVGDGWRLKVRLKRPRGLQNPAGFDYERWLFAQEVEAKGYVREWSGNQSVELLDDASWMNRMRQEIARRIDRHTQGGVASALLKALAVGDKRGVDQAAWLVFNRTGTNHLMAISGLHVGIVAGWLMYAGSWLWRRSERLCLHMPALKAGAILALFGALLYAALAGFSLPTQRALLMLATTLGALILGYRVSVSRSLLLALFLVVLLDPFAPMRVGFWLSFLAVAVILWSVGGRIAPWRGWRQGVWVQWYVTLGLLPILFLFFGQASLISPVVNLVMVPWFSLVLVPMTLLGLPCLLISALADSWFTWLGALAGVTYQILEWFSSLSIALFVLPESGVWPWFAAMLGCLLLLMPGGMPGRWMGVWFCLPVLLIAPERPREGDLWFTLLDVGQGLACVVETREHLLLYDTGPSKGSGFNAADSAIIPYLRARGHLRVDRLVVSNGDRDHAGGLDSLRDAFPVADILSGEPEEIEQARACRAGERWSWDGVTFQLLHPSGGDRIKNANDRSCVLQIISGDWKILLPGDIEKEGESRLLQRYRDELKSELLVAPHHGSKSSSTAEFVAAVDPDWVLFSTGYKNSYGFPKPEVTQRWLSQGAVTLDTARTGAIQFRITPEQSKLRPRLYRELNLRYWSDTPVQE